MSARRWPAWLRQPPRARAAVVLLRTGARRAAARAATLTALAALLQACATPADADFQGPLPVRSQHPVQLTVLHLDAAGARPLGASEAVLRFDAAYSSLWLTGAGDNGNAFTMDGELLRLAARVGLGLGHGFELRTEIPVLHAGGGFLDGFVEGWHDTSGLPDQERDTAPRDDFLVRAARGPSVVYELDRTGVALLDVPVELRWTFLPVTPARPFGAGVRAAVELPTGDSDRGHGNGGVDAALGAYGELELRQLPLPLSLTAHAGHTFAATPRRAERGGLSYRVVTAAGRGAELVVAEGLSLLAQTELETSALRGLDFHEVGDPQWLFWGGARIALGPRTWLEVGIGEDLSPFVAPDFTVWVSVFGRFGGNVAGSSHGAASDRRGDGMGTQR